LSRKKTELSRKRSRSFAAKTVSVRKSEASRSSSTTTATEKKFLVKTGGPRPDPQRCPEAAQRSAVGACCVQFFPFFSAQVKREPDSTTGAVVGPLLIAANHVRNRALSRALSTTIPDIRARAEAAVAQQRKTAMAQRYEKTMDNTAAYAGRKQLPVSCQLPLLSRLMALLQRAGSSPAMTDARQADVFSRQTAVDVDAEREAPPPFVVDAR